MEHLVTENSEEPEIGKTPAVNRSEYVTQWISQAEFDETSSETSSTVYTSSAVESEDYLNNMASISLDEQRVNTVLNNSTQNSELARRLDVLQQVFNTRNNVQTFGTVNVENSTGVQFGNVTYITGPIHITDTNGGNIGVIHTNSNEGIRLTSEPSQVPTNSNTLSQEIHISPYNLSEDDRIPEANKLELDAQPEEEEEREEVNRNDAFVGQITRNIVGSVLKIIKRRTWLAQVPLEPYSYIEGPVPYVIISHTATEMTRTQADTVYLVRHIQCFHIESCRWNDIGYSFLVGGDGNIYEGRGWGVVGAHTFGYNRNAIGISFVGCFMRELPPPESLEACKLLIKRGIELGHIAPNYKLLAQCQCYPTESPGRKLYEHLKTWSHFVEQP